MKNKQRFWFLTNKELRNYLLFKLAEIILWVVNINVTLNFITVQKKVQDGFVKENWKAFIFLSIGSAVIVAALDMFSKVYGMKMSMYLRFNMFRRYRKLFQIYEKPIKLKADIIGDSFGIIDSVISLVFNSYLVFKTTEMVVFSKNTVISAIVLLILSSAFGVMRGLKRAKINKMNNAIQAKEGDLTKFYTFSRDFLENALYVLRIETNARIKANAITQLLTSLPSIAKECLVAISVFGFVKTLAEGEVYSSSYIIMTAFGVILSIAEGLSSILENIFACIKNSKDPDLQELNLFEAKEKFTLSEAIKHVIATASEFTIGKKFTADIVTPDGTKHYFLKHKLHINIGENILLIGQKGTGKTRFLQLLESLYEDKVMIYNDRTTVFAKFFDNFKSDIGWNYELIQKIAKGLKLNRLLIPEKQLKELDLRSINTGDMHLLAALIMLYYAVSKPEQARIIILDELLANIDKENAEGILKFVTDTCNSLGSTIIFVGHSQQSMIEPYCTSKWTMTSNQNTIFINEKTL